MTVYILGLVLAFLFGVVAGRFAKEEPPACSEVAHLEDGIHLPTDTYRYNPVSRRPERQS